MTTKRLPLLLFLLTALVPGAPAAQYDLWLLAGQSNMDGRGKAKDLPAAEREAVPGVSIFYRNPLASSERFCPLAPGFSWPPGYRGKLPSEAFGPELSFARALRKGAPDVPLALIKGSRGGSSLRTDWRLGEPDQPKTQGECYRCFVETWKLATAALAADGSTFRLRGLLWHQGEADSGLSQADYLDLLTRFIARVRADVGRAELPVLIGEVYDNGKRDNVRAAQRQAAEAIPHTVFVSAAGLQTFDNGTHFDAASQVTLGERFAAAALALK